MEKSPLVHKRKVDTNTNLMAKLDANVKVNHLEPGVRTS